MTTPPVNIALVRVGQNPAVSQDQYRTLTCVNCFAVQLLLLLLLLGAERAGSPKE
jgi:hypothetical protein